MIKEGGHVKEKRFHTLLFKAVPQTSMRYAMGANVKEKRFHTPLFKAVPQAVLRYAMGANVKEKRFHTPLFKAVPQTSLRYAMGARVRENIILKGCHLQILSLIFICGSIAGMPVICIGCKHDQKGFKVFAD